MKDFRLRSVCTTRDLLNVMGLTPIYMKLLLREGVRGLIRQA